MVGLGGSAVAGSVSTGISFFNGEDMKGGGGDGGAALEFGISNLFCLLQVLSIVSVWHDKKAK